MVAYGTKYLTGYDTLPELIYPEEVLELVDPGTLPDLLVLLPWGPFLKESFRSAAHYQVPTKSINVFYFIKEINRRVKNRILHSNTYN